MTAAITGRPAWEVADVIRQHGAAFRARHGGHLTTAQTKALRDLAACRTAALGGHVERCLDCGHDRIAYNSCRNRHCPKCQALARARWLQREAEHLLPVEYHHVVFTLPAELADLALANPAVVYDLLFQAASATLREVAANPKRLGASIGVLMVLHTWGQNLHHHPHVHCVVTGGGLSSNAQGAVDTSPRWVACRPGFFLPVRVLSRLFRGKFLAGLRDRFDQLQLAFPGRLARLAEPAAFARWRSPLYAKDWVVYAKRPFGGPAQVLKYLARYTHRVAISNHRLVKIADGQVTFRCKDYAENHRQKGMTLSADEFLRRFVQHILPVRFVKVRHYGLLANRFRADRLALCRRLLPVVAAATMPLTDAHHHEPPSAPANVPTCPHCGGTRFFRHPLPADHPHVPAAPDPVTGRDTS
jgi:putative transposase/transposase-like zinc-binding protein